MDREKYYAKFLDWHKDWPKPGINFCDVWQLIERVDICGALEQLIMLRWESVFLGGGPVYLGGIEARGFAVAGILSVADISGFTFVPIRKAGKLPPGNLVSQDIALEYGTATLEMRYARKPGSGLILVDDVLATGGTLDGAKALAEKAGYNVLGAVVLVNLLDVPKASSQWTKDNLISLIEVNAC